MHYCFSLSSFTVQVALSEAGSHCHVLEERNAALRRVRSATVGRDSKSCQIMTLINSKASQWQLILYCLSPVPTRYVFYFPHHHPLHTQLSSPSQSITDICSCLRSSSFEHFLESPSRKSMCTFVSFSHRRCHGTHIHT